MILFQLLFQTFVGSFFPPCKILWCMCIFPVFGHDIFFFFYLFSLWHCSHTVGTFKILRFFSLVRIEFKCKFSELWELRQRKCYVSTRNFYGGVCNAFKFLFFFVLSWWLNVNAFLSIMCMKRKWNLFLASRAKLPCEKWNELKINAEIETNWEASRKKEKMKE